MHCSVPFLVEKEGVHVQDCDNDPAMLVAWAHACSCFDRFVAIVLYSRNHAQRCCAQADLVLTSIGYKAVAMEGASFDAARGVIRHRCAL